MRLKNALSFSHELLKNSVQKGDTVVDATVGNGYDTVLLAKLVTESGQVFGFDIQQQAIEMTTQKLQAEGVEKQVTLFHAGHQDFQHYVPKTCVISAVIFNLGYLPGSDKQIVTQAETTLSAIEKIVGQLKKSALAIIVVYSGHEGGSEEKDALLNWAMALDQQDYTVLQYGCINQKNAPPFVLAIEKRNDPNE